MKHAVVIILSIIHLLSCISYGITCYISDDAGSPISEIRYSNESIYVTGEWDIYDFPCPIGDIYIVPNRDWSGISYRVLVDCISSLPNAVEGCGGAGAFYGAPIAFPIVPVGEYDIVMDEEQDGAYNAGTDYVLGNGSEPGLVIRRGEPVPAWQIAEIADLKAEAAEDASLIRSGMAIYDAYQLYNTLRTYGDLCLAVLTGSWGAAILTGGGIVLGALGVITNYNDWVIQVGTELLKAHATHQAEIAEGIAADPPDSLNYEYVALPFPFYNDSIPIDDEYAIRYYRAIHWTSVLNSYRQCLLSTIERYQGAIDMENAYAQRLQAKMLTQFSELVKDAIDSTNSAYAALADIIDSMGLGESIYSDSASLDSLQQRLISSGFSTDEINRFHNIGLNDAQIESIRTQIVAIPIDSLNDMSAYQFLDSLGDRLTQSHTPLDSLADFGLKIVDSLTDGSYSFPDRDPIVEINGPYYTVEDSSINFSASGTNDPYGYSIDYYWELDGDGEFDDGIIQTPTWIYNEPGIYIVGLKVENEIGYVGYGFTYVIVDIGNRCPQFTSTEPDTPFVLETITKSSINFSVTFDDPESDPVTASWFLNDTPVGSGNSYLFSESDTGIYRIVCVISDDIPGNRDNRHWWKVHIIEDLEIEQDYMMQDNSVVASVIPNPFNAISEIKFNLTKQSMISISIFDISGHKIRMLLCETLSAGKHSVIWDGTDDTGNYVKSGVYLVNLSVNDKILTEKVVLIK